jgi:hypothetical protein
MTELAHGSNVAGLETTATFDPSSDEFVIHTPHLGATKWWIGGAASTATHAAVFAQLIVNGKKHGVKTFVTQLRDTKYVLPSWSSALKHNSQLTTDSLLTRRTFQLLPGITIGDIGKKMGRDGIGESLGSGDTDAMLITRQRIHPVHLCPSSSCTHAHEAHSGVSRGSRHRTGACLTWHNLDPGLITSPWLS